MSRIELLARAFNGTVVEDNGYRGVFHQEETGKYFRYHSVLGVHEVIRQPRSWRSIRLILSADEVRPFLEECGLTTKPAPAEKPLDALIRETGGELVAIFGTGGGVFRLGKYHYRFSNISGLDVVEYVVTKWRSVKHLATRAEALRRLHRGDVAQLFTEHQKESVA